MNGGHLVLYGLMFVSIWVVYRWEISRHFPEDEEAE